MKNCLVNAGQQFFITKNNKTDVIAGYPWFGSWGRDTFIALPGLRVAESNEKCMTVIDTMVKKLKDGLFPNCGTDENPSYNSVDAPMWFFRALQICSESIDAKSVWKKYKKSIISILEAYKNGTAYNIKMLENGLIYAKEEGKALTWMDAINNNGPVTPRGGCPIEINALWYNALEYALELAREAKDNNFIKNWKELPNLVKESMNKEFFSERYNYPADYIDNDYKDFSVRPNMVIATGLKYSPFSKNINNNILNVAKQELLTPFGLRTLSPKNPAYKGIYKGNQDQRDATYHQGTVWPWLLEFYAEGLILNEHPEKENIRYMLKNIETALFVHGISSISEIYDGNPPFKSRGTISQAWSVSAILRIMELTNF
jgi:predicted glycogen debranching enzyme